MSDTLESANSSARKRLGLPDEAPEAPLTLRDKANRVAGFAILTGAVGLLCFGAVSGIQDQIERDTKDWALAQKIRKECPVVTSFCEIRAHQNIKFWDLRRHDVDTFACANPEGEQRWNLDRSGESVSVGSGGFKIGDPSARVDEAAQKSGCKPGGKA